MQPVMSVIVLTQNEEDNVGRALRNLLHFVDLGKGSFIPIEVIVVDGGSTDRTKKIVKSFETYFYIKVINKPFTNFSDARNVGIENTETNIILMCDADETFETKLNWHIVDFVNSEAIAWWFPRVRLFPDNKHYLYREFPDPQMRLFKKVNGVKFVNDVHEQLSINGKQLSIDCKAGVFTKKINFYHWDLLQSEEKLKEKTERWAKLADKNLIPTGSYIFKRHEHPYMPLEHNFISVPDGFNVNQMDDLNRRIKLGGVDNARMGKILELAHGEKQNIVDLGCSTGEISMALANNNTVIAIDSNITQIEKLKSKSSCVKEWKHCFAEDTGIDNQWADIVVATEILEHCEDPDKILKEIIRILKPDGKVIISVPNVDSKYELRSASPDHLHFYWPDKLEGILKKYFNKIEFIDFGRGAKEDAMIIIEAKK